MRPTNGRHVLRDDYLLELITPPVAESRHWAIIRWETAYDGAVVLSRRLIEESFSLSLVGNSCSVIKMDAGETPR